MNKISAYLLLFLLVACTPDKPIEKPPLVQRHFETLRVENPIELLNIEKHFSPQERYMMENGLVNLQELDSTLHLKLVYNDTCNFLHRKIYDSLSIAFLPCAIAIKLCNAQYFLKQIDLDLSLYIFDAARPHHIQKFIWDSLKMEPNIKYNYIATPWDISLHNYGAAIDLSIIDLRNKKLLEMGTDFDHFGQLAGPIHEPRFLKNKQLSDTAYKNRVLLRKVMKKAGFNPIPSEWWHFNACDKEYAAQNYILLK